LWSPLAVPEPSGRSGQRRRRSRNALAIGCIRLAAVRYPHARRGRRVPVLCCTAFYPRGFSPPPGADLTTLECSRSLPLLAKKKKREAVHRRRPDCLAHGDPAISWNLADAESFMPQSSSPHLNAPPLPPPPGHPSGGQPRPDFEKKTKKKKKNIFVGRTARGHCRFAVRENPSACT